MGNRLSKITTRTGDNGTTGLGNGVRVDKDDLRVHAMGDVDELNSSLGLLLTETLPASMREELLRIQHDLFDLGGELSIPGHTMLHELQVARLDALIAHYNAALPPLREFVLPGGCRAAALAHMCRTICRRAERWTASLGKQTAINHCGLQYLNRLSDLLFIIARSLNRDAGTGDVLWQRSSDAE